MNELLSKVIPLALGAAVSPTVLAAIVLLALAIITLLRPQTHSDTGTPVHTSNPESSTGLLPVFGLGFDLYLIYRAL